MNQLATLIILRVVVWCVNAGQIIAGPSRQKTAEIMYSTLGALGALLRELWPFQTLTRFFLGHPVHKIVYHDTNVSLASMSVLTLINHFEL